MKKVLAVFVLVLAFAATAAYADSVGMIGKAVDSVYPIYLNGQRLPVDAISIEGTSYLPTRLIAESAGYDIKFENEQIYLDKQAAISTTTQAVQAEQQVSKEVNTMQCYKVTIDGIDIPRKPGETFRYQVLDGEAYLDHVAFGRYAVWDGNKMELNILGKNIIAYKGQKYSPGIDCFEQYGMYFFKLSAIGLHPTITGDELQLSN